MYAILVPHGFNISVTYKTSTFWPVEVKIPCAKWTFMNILTLDSRIYPAVLWTLHMLMEKKLVQYNKIKELCLLLCSLMALTW